MWTTASRQFEGFLGRKSQRIYAISKNTSCRCPIPLTAMWRSKKYNLQVLGFSSSQSKPSGLADRNKSAPVGCLPDNCCWSALRSRPSGMDVKLNKLSRAKLGGLFAVFILLYIIAVAIGLTGDMVVSIVRAWNWMLFRPAICRQCSSRDCNQ